MKKIINTIFIIILLISCIGNVLLLNRLENKTNELIEIYNTESELIIVDSVEIFDTVYLTRYDTVRLTKCQIDTLVINDSIVIMDSVDVVIPIDYKHYSDTLNHNAISFNLSGYNCKIDSLYVKNFLSVPTQEKAVKKWYNNLEFGIGLGVTYIDRFRLIPNVGIYYQLF